MSFLTEPRVNNEVIEPRVLFENIPLSAISRKTGEKLSLLLNSEKVLRTEDGYFRDWRGIFTLSDFTQSEYALITESRDKTGKLLELWLKRNKDSNITVTLSRLQECLGLIDRYDVYDDTFVLFIEDAKTFLSKSHTDDVHNSSANKIVVKADPDNDIITIQDVESREKGLPLKIFDAFVIYNEKDVEFATKLIEKCEKMGHSLCVKDRDLLGGFPLESDAILKLLENRCQRLIVIVSEAFLKSPMQVFITSFAQSLGIEQNQRKIIPILLEQCDLPQMLRFCFRFDYYKNSKIYNFWDRLDKTIKTRPTVARKSQHENDKSSPLDDRQQAYTIIETSTQSGESKRSSKKISSRKSSPEQIKQIWPPPPKLRAASSMLSLKSDQPQPAKKLSQSSSDLNQIDSGDVKTETNTTKRKKWYKIFLPPSGTKHLREKVFETLPEINEQERDMRPWYKIKKKKSKVAITSEN